MKAVIIYTTEGGNTEAYTNVALQHLKTLGVDCELKHVSKASPDDLKGKDFFILAEPTWGDGEHYDNWIPFDEALQKADLKGTKGAVIAGCDRSYAQFGVAVDLMETTITKAGAQILQRGLKIELAPTEKLYEYLKGTWLTDLVKRAKGELAVEPNTPRMTLAEVCKIMGKPEPEAGGAGAAADASKAAMPPKKKPPKVLPPPKDAIAPARQFEKKFTPVDVARRRFAQGATYGSLMAVTGFVHYFFFPNGLVYNGALFEPKTSFKIGTVDDYQTGTVDTRWQSSQRIWVIRDATQLYVIHAKCTHLGCTPDWKEAENKFKCPCHGSGFYKSGINFEGPAPVPLRRLYVGIDPADGQIVVDRAREFRQEFEEWGKSDAFIPL